MKNLYLILLIFPFVSCINSEQKEQVNALFSKEKPSQDSIILVDQSYFFDNISAFFILINEDDKEIKEELMLLSSTQIANTVYENNEDVEILKILFYDKKVIMPDTIESREHLFQFIEKSLIYYGHLTAENFIGFAEINREHYENQEPFDFVSYPVKKLFELK